MVLVSLVVGFVIGVGVGLLYRSKISGHVKDALKWGRQKADEIEKDL